jgi:taurine---2-oxoglutarate transaminase
MTNKTDQMIQDCKDHSFYTWSVQQDVKPLPVEHAERIYLYTPDGEKIIDFNSGSMCINIGHGNQRVVKAIQNQAQELAYAAPGTATAVRARTSKLLSEIVPGDINTFLFTLSGAEANENAIRLARLYTGRQKILSRYRSYHGATNLCMQLTGDPRRWANEPGTPGIVRVMDPTPYDYSFGTTEEEITANNLKYLEEVIMYEGGHTIAAMIIETVTGTNGILPPPKGYLEGLRALLDKHGILLICDEVMSGFGRTGKMFAFEHGGIVPDLVAMAKGLTSAYMPLGAVGMRDHIAEYFEDKPYMGGLTYNSHPMGLAAAEAAINVLIDDDMIGNSARLGALMTELLADLKAKHPCIKETRNIGLFGMVDLQKNSQGERLAPYNGTHPAQAEFLAALRSRGLMTFMRWGSFMCNPPLCITEEELRHCFTIIDASLSVVDAHMES